MIKREAERRMNSEPSKEKNLIPAIMIKSSRCKEMNGQFESENYFISGRRLDSRVLLASGYLSPCNVLVLSCKIQ